VRTVSDRWVQTAASADQTVVETVEVLDEQGNVTLELETVSEGSVDEDESTIVRHDFSVTVIDEDGDLIPLIANDTLAPIARRLRVSRGFVWPGTPPETVPLVTGWLTSVSARSESGEVRVTGMDRMARLQSPSPRPVYINAGRRADLAIRDLLWTIDPTVEFDLMVSEWTLPRLSYEIETDIASQAAGPDGLAEAVGAELFVNRDDRMEMRPVPTATGLPVARFVEGPSCTVVSADWTWDSDDIRNGVIVTAQHSSMSAAARGEAWDDDPESEYFRGGTYGERPRFVSTEKATTPGQATAMARGILERDLGGSFEIDLEIVPDPSIEVGDVVYVDLPSVKRTGLYVVARLGFSLGSISATESVTVRSGVVQ
jgi:hypothetical protein